MLKIEHLNCGYGSVHAVHDVSFDVPAGSVFALLGPNGAGKTSTIMAIMGHVDIHGGRILLENADITYRPAVERRKPWSGLQKHQKPEIDNRLPAEVCEME